MGYAAVLLLCAGALLSTVSAVTPPARGNAGCVILTDTMYCYGGQSDTNSVLTSLNDSYSLNLTLGNGFNVNSALSAWTSVPNPSNFPLEPNFSFGCTANSNSSYVIVGGGGYNDSLNTTTLTNLAVEFNVQTDQWQVLPAPPFPQIEGTTATWDSNNNALFVWGGLPVLGSYKVSTIMYRYDITASKWDTITATVPTAVKIGARYDTNVIFSQTTGKIFYFGGIAPTTTSTYARPFTFSLLNETLVFDTSSQTWSYQVSLNNYPSARWGHTASYLPSSDQVLLYGGAFTYAGNNGTGALQDYCWLYDLQANIWKEMTPALMGTEYGAGSRYSHNAAMFYDRYMYILFGLAGANDYLTDIHVLDTETWTWQYLLPDTPQSGNSTSSTEANGGSSSSSSSLSSGTIAGIAVGGVAGAAAILLGIYFLCRRRPEHESLSAVQAEKNINNNSRDFPGSPYQPGSPAPPTYNDDEYDPHYSYHTPYRASSAIIGYTDSLISPRQSINFDRSLPMPRPDDHY